MNLYRTITDGDQNNAFWKNNDVKSNDDSFS